MEIIALNLCLSIDRLLVLRKQTSEATKAASIQESIGIESAAKTNMD